MKHTWTTTRKWECPKLEKGFEDLCKKHGYNITGYQEYSSKTIFRIEKNSVEIEYCIYHDSGNAQRSKLAFNNMERFYEVKAQLLELMEENRDE